MMPLKEMRRCLTRPLDGGAGHFPSPQRGTAFQTSPVLTDQQKTNGLIAIEGVIVLVLFCNFYFIFFGERKKKHTKTDRAISPSLNVQYKSCFVFMFSREGATALPVNPVVMQLHVPRCNSALCCLVREQQRLLAEVEGASGSGRRVDVACCLQFSGSVFCNRMCSLAGLQALQLRVVFLLFTAI